jgi:hypothetical protein
MDKCIDPNIPKPADGRTVEDGHAGSQKGLGLDEATRQVSVGPDKDVILDPTRMPGRTAHHGMLHDYTVAAYVNGTAFGGKD